MNWYVSPNFCCWCILDKRKLLRLWRSRVKGQVSALWICIFFIFVYVIASVDKFPQGFEARQYSAWQGRTRQVGRLWHVPREYRWWPESYDFLWHAALPCTGGMCIRHCLAPEVCVRPEVCGAENIGLSSVVFLWFFLKDVWICRTNCIMTVKIIQCR